jgi:hypothetical protein
MGRPRKSPEKEFVNGGSMIFARPNPDGRPGTDLRLVDMSRKLSRNFLKHGRVEKARAREAKTDSLALITLTKIKLRTLESLTLFLIH